MSQSDVKNKKLLFIVIVGLMTALVFAGNYMSFQIGTQSRIHLGNSMCLLSGLMFGPLVGGLSSGLGGAIYDLTNPLYIASAPITFCTKFAMGFVSGLLVKVLSGKGKEHILGGRNLYGILIGAVCGQITYIVLYLGKSLVSNLLLGEPFKAALLALSTKAVASCTNGILAVIISVPLSIALAASLKSTQAGKYLVFSPSRNTRTKTAEN
ncbi:MAG: ECF transporter S component [Oscillospiraceae bacterium]|nr:ECF transporter S component [Oscillospiraceae bacterium]